MARSQPKTRDRLPKGQRRPSPAGPGPQPPADSATSLAGRASGAHSVSPRALIGYLLTCPRTDAWPGSVQARAGLIRRFASPAVRRPGRGAASGRPAAACGFQSATRTRSSALSTCQPARRHHNWQFCAAQLRRTRRRHTAHSRQVRLVLNRRQAARDAVSSRVGAPCRNWQVRGRHD
jgi:hypothetical protein